MYVKWLYVCKCSYNLHIAASYQMVYDMLCVSVHYDFNPNHIYIYMNMIITKALLT